MNYLIKQNKFVKGFTLVELVIVIVLIGILGGVASVKYIDFQYQAKIARLTAIQSALVSAADLVHNACVAGLDGCVATGSSRLNVAGKPVTTINGYPTMDNGGILSAANLDLNGFITFLSANGAGGTSLFMVYGAKLVNCAVVYTADTYTYSPLTTLITTSLITTDC